MNLYTVKERLQIGSDGVISLDNGRQMSRRSHRVTLVEPGEDRTIVRPNEPLDFKPGEIVGVFGDLSKYLKERLELVEGKKADDPEQEIAPADQRQVEIIAAIGRLDRDNMSHFTRDGTPAVKALEAELGYSIVAAERDAAWAKMLEAEKAAA